MRWRRLHPQGGEGDWDEYWESEPTWQPMARSHRSAFDRRMRPLEREAAGGGVASTRGGAHHRGHRHGHRVGHRRLASPPPLVAAPSRRPGGSRG